MEYIFLGDASMARDRDYLLANGIRYVVTVAPVDEFAAADYGSDGIVAYRIPIPDDGMHPLKPYLAEAFAVIREAVARKQGVLIHCIEGRSRSPSLVLAYLMVEKGLHLRQALELLRTHWTKAQPRYQLFDELLVLERDLTGSDVNSVSHSDNYEPIVLGPAPT